MTRRLDLGQLVGAAEIAARLGVSRPQVIHTWRRRHGEFPEPVLELDMGLIWFWPEVEAWADKTGRLK